VTSAEATIPGSHIERLALRVWTGAVLLAAVLLDALARRGTAGATN
jgi:hypothetical protein